MTEPDLIIVGAGSAGAVIAARVTENSARTVLLLEAGPDYADATRLPDDLRDGRKNSMFAHDWGYKHRPTAGQVLFRFPRGRVVGGSSAVNTCIALRGQPYDYDEWDLPEWTWERCLPAFKRLERDLDFGARSDIHGADGPIPLRRHPRAELARWQAAFLDACAEAGHPSCADSNDPTTTGAGAHAMNKIDGERMSAARCYLTPAVRARPNLTIRPGALVRRVRLENRRAVGVELTDGTVLRGRTIVLSSGAIGTPGILLRSGIGPAAQVAALGVEHLVDNRAVNARLLDHPGAAIFLLPKKLGVADVRAPIIQCALRTSFERPNDLVLQPGSFLHVPKLPLPLVSLMVMVGKPRGHGSLRFLSPDPAAAPFIDSAILHHPVDRAAAVHAVQILRDLAETRALRDLARFLWPRRRTLESASSIEAFVRKICDSGYHPAGTVPMGTATDERGHVLGVDELIVADASLMPTIPSSNINLPTLMIGERFGEWLCRPS